MFFKKIFENNIISLEQKLEIGKRIKNQSFEEQIDYLISTGIITKADALKTLSQLSGLKPVDLSRLTISDDVINLLSADFVWQHNICPFDFDQDSKLLKVACLFADNVNLSEKIKQITNIPNIELYVSFKSNLLCVLIEKYRIQSDSQTEENRSSISLKTIQDYPEKLTDSILVLNPDNEFNIPFWKTIVEMDYLIFLVDSIREAEEVMLNENIVKLFINSDCDSCLTSLCDKFKNINPTGAICYFQSESDILFDNGEINLQMDIINDNFRLMTMNVNDEHKEIIAHTTAVAEVTKNICAKMNCSETITLYAISGAYLHNYSSLFIDGINNTPDKTQSEIHLSAECLNKFKYTPKIIGMLRMAFKDINQYNGIKTFKTASNILTAADYFCHKYGEQKIFTTDEFNRFSEEIQLKVGSLFYKNVADALLNYALGKVEIGSQTNKNCSVVLFNNPPKDYLMLEDCLTNLEFDINAVTSYEKLIDSTNKKMPDIFIIQDQRDLGNLEKLLDDMKRDGINIKKKPTFILTELEDVSSITLLLQLGVEDVINVKKNLDPFLIKMIRIRNRIIEKTNDRIEMLEGIGTIGSLSDMNLIDLVQSMNSSRKTCLINITAMGQHIMIYINKGLVIYAECGDYCGEEAIQQGVGWEKGIWSVDHINVDDLPEPNISRPIDSILLEACRLIDESNKSNPEEDVDRAFDFLKE